MSEVSELTYGEAVREAIAEEMRRDPETNTRTVATLWIIFATRRAGQPIPG